MEINTLKECYKEYINYCRKNTWNWEMITNHLKKTEGKVENYYGEYSFDEFVEKSKSSQIFYERWCKK